MVVYTFCHLKIYAVIPATQCAAVEIKSDLLRVIDMSGAVFIIELPEFESV